MRNPFGWWKGGKKDERDEKCPSPVSPASSGFKRPATTTTTTTTTSHSSGISSAFKLLNPLNWIGGVGAGDFDLSFDEPSAGKSSRGGGGDDDLFGQDEFGNSDDLLLGERVNTRASMFLGKFTIEYLYELLEEWGVLGHLVERGYDITHSNIEVDTSDWFVHRLSIYDGPPSAGDDRVPILQLFVRRMNTMEVEGLKVFDSYLRFEEENSHENLEKSKDECLELMQTHIPPGIKCFRIEWLLMQDSRRGFSHRRLALPGQRFPGLGCARQISKMLFQLAVELETEAVINVPEFFHNALMYSPPFQFLHPLNASFFDGILSDLRPDIEAKGLSAVSWAIRLGKLRCHDCPDPILWEGLEQIVPLSDRMREYFAAQEYNELTAKYKRTGRFYIDWNVRDTKRLVKNNSRGIGVPLPRGLASIDEVRSESPAMGGSMRFSSSSFTSLSVQMPNSPVSGEEPPSPTSPGSDGEKRVIGGVFHAINDDDLSDSDMSSSLDN